MLVKCMNCNKEFEKKSYHIKRSPNNYCSRSCSAIANNKNPNIKRKQKTKKCKYCEKLIYSSHQRCKECIENTTLIDYSLKEAIYKEGHRASAFSLIRSRARQIARKLGLNKCAHCGYNKHVEMAHIKPIKDFDLDAKISEINHINNIIPLCPNCHWEFDNLNK